MKITKIVMLTILSLVLTFSCRKKNSNEEYKALEYWPFQYVKEVVDSSTENTWFVFTETTLSQLEKTQLIGILKARKIDYKECINNEVLVSKIYVPDIYDMAHLGEILKSRLKELYIKKDSQP